MEQLNEIKKRIRSVSDIRQMTRAMQLVSAAKMRKSKAQLDRVFPFFSLCAESMIEIQRSNTEVDNPYFTLRQKKPGETWKIGYFILTGDQGLAGAYNHNVVKIAEEHFRAKVLDNINKGLKTETTLYVFGNVGRDKLSRDGFPVDQEFSFPIAEPTYYEARSVADKIRTKFMEHELDLVYLVYTKMDSAINMTPIIQRVVPVNTEALRSILPVGQGDAGMALERGAQISYHPNADAVFSFLIDTYLNAMMYGALVEAYASEQTARMTAMDNATNNADDMLAELTKKSNQARQARITNELIEIVNGANQVQ